MNQPHAVTRRGLSLSKKWFYYFFDKLQTF